MNKRRLLQLADLLEADANNPKGIQFDLDTWAERVGRERFPSRLKKLDCGTKACAVGLACLSGVFADEGLSWKTMSDENNIDPLYDGKVGHTAVERFFDITYDQFCRLFASAFYDEDQRIGADGERAVSQRIRGLVAGATV